MNLDPADWVRLVNLVLVLAATGIAASMWRYWLVLPTGRRFFVLAALGLNFLWGWGGVEAWLHDIPGGTRVLLATPFHAWLLTALIIMRKEEK